MEKQIKLVLSPFSPNIEVVGDIIINSHVPYSEQDITLQINPNIQAYKEKDGDKNLDIRQIMVTTETEDTKTLHFDFKEDNIQLVKVDNKEYKIKLLNIGKEKLEGQEFMAFEFYIEW